MCLYVGSAVILANLLSQKNGATKKDIEAYCQQLRDAFQTARPVSHVYINVNDRELSRALYKYSKEFRYFQERFYIIDGFNLKHFNARYEDGVVSTFEEVALALKSLI